ncbi:hypothetical protein TIFTF001_022372 [Ficus carica]|uniref:Uncharacterized protein n=1 Tax=Ficus carica TaxID=3494 RepID=A0AA88DCQ9_FICCA|nr:hypothetical protein TIFTF001_022372 [Ficus carica]
MKKKSLDFGDLDQTEPISIRFEIWSSNGCDQSLPGVAIGSEIWSSNGRDRSLPSVAISGHEAVLIFSSISPFSILKTLMFVENSSVRKN